jgi:3-deoxy-D-manno-octulosonic-acid transferase
MSLAAFSRLYAVLWHALLPLALAYLLWRSRRDPDYRRHLGERFGRYRERMAGSVWIHAVSLGEVRSAVPLARALLGRGERVVLTHLTPAGRREAARVFADEIAAGRAAAVWLPLELGWAFRGFFRAFAPRAGLVMEVEHWPRMILAARAAGVPLFPCNAQYPARSFAADRARRSWRFRLLALYAGAFVKSDLQAERFRAAGLATVTVTGETRFDQPVPEPQVRAGRAARAALAAQRPTVAIASAVEGEDDIYISAIRTLHAEAARSREPRPLVLYIPRRPERFAAVAATLAAAGLRVIRRSEVLDADFRPAASSWPKYPAGGPGGATPPGGGAGDPDILLGDSLGEMYAYLAMADRVVVGGGFTPAGAHNIIEPLVMGRPVVTGPVTWPIEYPFAEAAAAGLARSVPDAPGLVAALRGDLPPPGAAAAFVAAHSGAAARTLAALDALTSR